MFSAHVERVIRASCVARMRRARPCLPGLAVILIGAAAASAQAPAHDNWATPVTITSLPHLSSEPNAAAATADAADPVPWCSFGGHHTLWYRYITGPAAEYLSITTAGSSYRAALAVYKGSPGAFVETPEGCNYDAQLPEQGALAGVRLEASTTYSILVSSAYALHLPATLHLSVTAAPRYVVTKVEDTLDGSCDADCSLREAVSAHNAAPGVVVVPAGTYVLTRTGSGEDGNATGDLDITAPGMLYGAGAEASIIDGNGTDRVLQFFDLPDGRETKGVAGVSVRNGRATDGAGLHLTAGYFGVVSAVTLADSVADNFGGGLYAGGWGLVTGCRFERNSAAGGGGIHLTADSWMQVESSTLAENTGSATAGGLDARCNICELYNVTFSRNQGRLGGGIYADLALEGGFSGHLYTSNLSLVANHAEMGAGAHLRRGVLHLNNSLFADHTIVATGMGVDCHNEGGPGSFVMGTSNIFESHQESRCLFIPQFSANNIYNVDARVSPVLALNGGPTPTHALLPGSPAIDSAEPTCRLLIFESWRTGPTSDQRGRPRTTDGNGDGVGTCDRGAYERTRIKGDFDRDRGTDILLRDMGTNAHVAWLMGGTTRLAEATLTPAPTAGWRVEALDDFSGDEADDLVWRDQAGGAVEFWRLGGATGLERQGAPIPITNAPTLDASWDLAASADFNRDGRADLLWRNTQTQKLEVWAMAGTAREGVITPVPDQAAHANWSVVGALDLDGDGTSDLLWYNATTGKVVQWLMNDAVQRTTGRFMTPANAGNNNWKVVAAGDYGRGPGGAPGTGDLVWRNDTSGKLVVWHMDWTGTRTAGVFTSPDQPEPPLDWEVAGPR